MLTMKYRSHPSTHGNRAYTRRLRSKVNGVYPDCLPFGLGAGPAQLSQLAGMPANDCHSAHWPWWRYGWPIAGTAVLHVYICELVLLTHYYAPGSPTC